MSRRAEVHSRAGGGGERGSAGLLTLWMALLVLGASVALVVLGGVLVARHRAARTADLAALAAAGAAAGWSSDPCASAARVVSGVGAQLVGCRVAADGSMLVAVAVAVPGPVSAALGLPPARARARAGVVASAQRARQVSSRRADGRGWTPTPSEDP